jgi:hypothetical protein
MASTNGAVFLARNVSLATRAVFTSLSIDGIILTSRMAGVRASGDRLLRRSRYGHLRGLVVQVTRLDPGSSREDVVEGG